VVGDPAERTLVEHARSPSRTWPDLVGQERGEAQQMLIGSVTERLLKSLPCDVLAVPSKQ
jgi:nucleotide-binding universal stress UspA family protein